MPTKDPKLWIIPALIGLLGGGGGTAGIQWMWDDPLVDFRLSSHERRLNDLEATTGSLPPRALLERISELERDVHLLKAISAIPPGP